MKTKEAMSTPTQTDPSVAPTEADPIPPGWQAQNVVPVGYSAMQGRTAFKLTIKEVDGRWYLYTAREGLHILDVTDPTYPIYLRYFPAPANTMVSQVTLHGDLLLLGLAKPPEPGDFVGTTDSYNELHGPAPADKCYEEGVQFYDISDPVEPQLLSHWTTGALGTHRNGYPGGSYAFLSATAPGFRGMTLAVLDVSDPRHPEQVSRWWHPGQRGDEPRAKNTPAFHGPAHLSPDGKMLTMGYTPSLINLDFSDPTSPTLIGELQMCPPFVYVGTQTVHTSVPIWSRDLVFINSEAQRPNADEGAHFAALVDNSDPANPTLLSIFPTPVPPPDAPYANFGAKGGRFGPHNANTEISNPFVEPVTDTIYLTYFNAGLRIYDISDPRMPYETGYFIPPNPPEPIRTQVGSLAVTQTQDVLVDTRGYIYISDSAWGLWILKREDS